MSESTEFYQRMRQLYPAVSDVDLLPRSWHKDKSVQHLSLSHNNLRVHYKGSGKTGKEAAAVRTHLPIPAACGVYYYEVKVVSKGREGHIGVGLSGGNVSLSRLPGWEKNSFGYHGDDGCAFQSSGTGSAYGPTFSTGDVIGCCWNMMDNTVFYTKNGVNLGLAFRDVPSVLYPTVGLQTPGEVVEANFGQHAFVFAINDYVAESRRRLFSQLMLGVSDNSEPASVARRADSETALRHLVLDYISAQGYSETALALSRLTNEPLTDSVQSMRNRQRISKLICSGKVSRAIRLTQRLYPEVLERNAEVLFHLRCRQFVEVLSGHDRIDSQFVSSCNLMKRSQLNGNGNSNSSHCSPPKNLADNSGDGAQFDYVDDVTSDADAAASDEDEPEDEQFADASSSFDPPADATVQLSGSEPDDYTEDVEMRDGNTTNGDCIVEKRSCATKPKQNGHNCSPPRLSDADSAALIEFGKQLYAQLLALYGVGVTSPVTPSGLFTSPACPISNDLCSPASSLTASVNWWDQAPPSTVPPAPNLASLSLFNALSSLPAQFAAGAASATGNPLVLVGLAGSGPITLPHPLPLQLAGVSLPLGHSAAASAFTLAYGLPTIPPPQPISASNDSLDAGRVARFDRERARLIDMFTQFGCGHRNPDLDCVQRAREAVATELNSAILAGRSRPGDKRSSFDTTEYRPALDTLLGHLGKALRQMASASIPSAGLLDLGEFVNHS